MTKEISTHLGFAEYFGKNHLYDGNYDPCCTGPEQEVLAYLAGLKNSDFGADDLSWPGSNGLWYSGADARAAIEAEIARLTGATSRYNSVVAAGGSPDDALNSVYNSES